MTGRADWTPPASPLTCAGGCPAGGELRDRGHLGRRLWFTLGLTAAYMGAEVAGGLLANSLALLADAGHMLSDVAALGLSLTAIWFARAEPTARRTFGSHRMEILAALANGAALVTMAIFIFIEAGERLVAPPEVRGGLMLAVAGGGLAVNLAGLVILHGGREASLNVRGAFLHVLSDALGSLGALASGALIWGLGWTWADPAASILIGLLIIWSAWALIKETLAVLMESAPSHIDVAEVRAAMEGVAGVRDVHDLHVWTITSGLECLSGHVVTTSDHDDYRVLTDVSRLLRQRFALDHLTIQIEPEGFAHAGEGG